MRSGRLHRSSLSDTVYTGNIFTVKAELHPRPPSPHKPDAESGLIYPPTPIQEPVYEWLVGKTWQAFRSEWRFSMMGLGSIPEHMRAPNWELQYLRFAWVREHETLSVIILFFWRVFTLTWAAVCLAHSVSLLGDGSRWEYHFEHWVLCALVAQYALELLLVMNGQCVTCIPFYLCLCRLARAVASPLVIHNLLSFLLLDIPFHQITKVDDRVSWGLLLPVVCPLLDTFLASHRAPRVLHVVYPTLFWLVFVAWSGFYYAFVLSKSERIHYPVAVDWGDPVWRVIDLLVNTVLLCPLTVLLLWSLMHVRERLRPLSPDEERDDETGLPILTFLGLVQLNGVRKSDMESVTTIDQVFGRRPSVTKLVVERIASAQSSTSRGGTGSDDDDGSRNTSRRTSISSPTRGLSCSPIRGATRSKSSSVSRASVCGDDEDKRGNLTPTQGFTFSPIRGASGSKGNRNKKPTNVLYKPTEEFARDLRRERRASVGSGIGGGGSGGCGRGRTLTRSSSLEQALPHASRTKSAECGTALESTGQHKRRHSLASLPQIF